MDQGIAIIIASAISVIGAVGGTLGGVLISNHHTATIDRQRIAYEERKERAKQNSEAIREVYQTLLNVDDLCDQLAYDVKNSNIPDQAVVERIKKIRTTSQIITTLIRLHISDLGKDLEEYSVVLVNYWNTLGGLAAAKSAEYPHLEVNYEKVEQTNRIYKNTLEKILIKLEEIA